jgi:hypothetical protein
MLIADIAKVSESMPDSVVGGEDLVGCAASGTLRAGLRSHDENLKLEWRLFMVATHFLVTGMANCDVYDWAGPVIDPAY